MDTVVVHQDDTADKPNCVPEEKDLKRTLRPKLVSKYDLTKPAKRSAFEVEKSAGTDDKKNVSVDSSIIAAAEFGANIDGDDFFASESAKEASN